MMEFSILCLRSIYLTCNKCFSFLTYTSGEHRISCLVSLNKKCFNIIACTAVIIPLVELRGARNPKLKFWPTGLRVKPVLAHSAFGGLAQLPKTSIRKACCEIKYL